MRSDGRILGFYDIFLILGVILTSMAYSLTSGDFDILGTAAGISGVICVVLVAKGSIWNYVFGLVNVAAYAIISWKASLYGDAALNALYYLPMQFIGWWQWRRRGAAATRAEADNPEQDVRVRARRLTAIRRLILAFGSASLVVAGGFILRSLGDPQPFKDSATTVLSIIAQYLMAFAYMEQWVLWILTNLISIIMWGVLMAHDEAHAGLMVIMWSFYLLNSINGLRVWMKLSAARNGNVKKL